MSNTDLYLNNMHPIVRWIQFLIHMFIIKALINPCLLNSEIMLILKLKRNFTWQWECEREKSRSNPRRLAHTLDQLSFSPITLNNVTIIIKKLCNYMTSSKQRNHTKMPRSVVNIVAIDVIVYDWVYFPKVVDDSLTRQV